MPARFSNAMRSIIGQQRGIDYTHFIGYAPGMPAGTLDHKRSGRRAASPRVISLSCLASILILLCGAGNIMVQSQTRGCTDVKFTIVDTLAKGYFLAAGESATISWSKPSGGSEFCPSVVQTSADWLSVSPSASTSTSGRATFTAQANPTSTKRSATLTISSGAGADATPKTYEQNGQEQPLTLPTSLTFSAALNSATQTRSVAISVAGSQTSVEFSLSATTASGGRWLSVAPASGIAPISISVTVNPAGLAPGTYSGSIAASTAIGMAGVMNVTLTVTGGPSLVGPPLVGFTLSNLVTQATKLISINGLNLPPIALNYDVVYPNQQAAGWLSVAPSSLVTPAALALTANSSSLAPGRYLALLSASPASGQQTLAPVNVPVVMSIRSSTGGFGPLNLQPECIWLSRDIPAPAPGTTTIEQELNCTYTRNANADWTSGEVQVSANTALGFSSYLSFNQVEKDWLTARLAGNQLPTLDQNVTFPQGMTTTSIALTVQAESLRLASQTALVSAGVTNQLGNNLAAVTAASRPTLSLAPSSVTFDYMAGQSPAPQTIMVSAVGGTIPFNIEATDGWVSITPASGTATPSGPVPVSVSVNPATLTQNTNASSLTVRRSDEPATSPQIISVVANVTSPTRPVITQVVNGASFEPPDIAPGTWATIKGTNLARPNPGRVWRGDEFVGGTLLPKSLDGVSVTVNGTQAYVGYISPDQVNFIPAASSTDGLVNVVVNNNGATSVAVSAPLRRYSPGFFRYLPSRYAIAQRHPDLALIGNPDVVPGTVPAKPGDVLILWVTGFGPTSPPGTEGALPVVGTVLANLPTLQFNGANVPLIGAATSAFAGAQQFSFQVPAGTPDGNVEIKASVGGFSSANGVLIFVRK